MLDFIGYCNGAPSKSKCAAFDRSLAKPFALPVLKNGAILTGKTWNTAILYNYCLVVIDFDIKPGENLSVDKLPDLCYTTMLCRTGGGGLHVYFLVKDAVIHNQAHKNPRLDCLKGIDIRGEGGIIFAPGCKFTDHQNSYTLLKQKDPATITKAEFDGIMNELLEFKPKPLSFTGMRQGFVDIIEGKYIIPHLKDEITGIEEYIIWKAFYREVHSFGIDVDNIWAIWSRNPNLQPEFNQKTAEYQVSKIRPDYLIKRPTTKLYFKIFPQYKIDLPPSIKKEEKDEQIPWYFEFDVYWDENYASIMIWIDDWNKWVLYNDKGYFEPISDLEFDKIIFDWLEVKKIKLSLHKVNLAKKKIISSHYTTLNMFDADLNIRNVKNGLLYLDDLILHEHTPDYFSLCQANVNYLEPQELLPTPCWDGIREKYPINIKKVEWYLRCIIFNNMSNELALFIVGVNRSSKGSTLGLISEMFPDTLTSHQSLEALGNSFGLSTLIGKNLNIDSEGTITRLGATSIKYLKTIVGRDGKITVNIKGVKQFDHDFNPFFFLFAMNQLYRLPGTDLTAFFSRIFIVEFSKQENKPDPTFKSRLRKEADSVFSQLIHEGYEDFISFYEKIWGKKYILKDFITEMALIWESWSNPVSIVCKDLFIKDEGTNRMEIEEVTDLVTDGLAEHGYGIPANNAVKAQITKVFKRMKISKSHSNKQYYYQPVRLVNETNGLPKKKEETKPVVIWNDAELAEIEEEINKTNKKSPIPGKPTLITYAEEPKQEKVTDTYEEIKDEINIPEKLDDLELTSLIEEAQEEIAEEKEEKVKAPEVTETQTRKILEHLSALHEEYPTVDYFSTEDLFEPLYSQMSADEYRAAIAALVGLGNVEVSEFGIKLRR